jgi:hypothetical protein
MKKAAEIFMAASTRIIIAAKCTASCSIYLAASLVSRWKYTREILPAPSAVGQARRSAVKSRKGVATLGPNRQLFSENTVAVNFRVPESVHAEAKKIAAERRCYVADVIRFALIKYLMERRDTVV